MSDYIGSLEEHVDNDVSGQGVTDDEIERRWSGWYRVIPEPVAKPVMSEAMARRSDELFYSPEFSSAYYGR